jgi:predicted membrane channel-forming protein YqfA (hemolysin III family)
MNKNKSKISNNILASFFLFDFRLVRDLRIDHSHCWILVLALRCIGTSCLLLLLSSRVDSRFPSLRASDIVCGDSLILLYILQAFSNASVLVKLPQVFIGGVSYCVNGNGIRDICWGLNRGVLLSNNISLLLEFLF